MVLFQRRWKNQGVTCWYIAWLWKLHFKRESRVISLNQGAPPTRHVSNFPNKTPTSNGQTTRDFNAFDQHPLWHPLTTTEWTSKFTLTAQQHLLHIFQQAVFLMRPRRGKQAKYPTQLEGTRTQHFHTLQPTNQPTNQPTQNDTSQLTTVTNEPNPQIESKKYKRSKHRNERKSEKH